jgi:hypothetical protein
MRPALPLLLAFAACAVPQRPPPPAPYVDPWDAQHAALVARLAADQAEYERRNPAPTPQPLPPPTDPVAFDPPPPPCPAEVRAKCHRVVYHGIAVPQRIDTYTVTEDGVTPDPTRYANTEDVSVAIWECPKSAPAALKQAARRCD